MILFGIWFWRVNKLPRLLTFRVVVLMECSERGRDVDVGKSVDRFIGVLFGSWCVWCCKNEILIGGLE